MDNQLVLNACIKNKVYVECNQCLSFFAPVISKLFRKSKFVHIIRHPGDFVRGGIRKGWHKNDSIWESGRVRMIDQGEWNRLDQMERLFWVWWVTNQFLEEFKKQGRLLTQDWDKYNGATVVFEPMRMTPKQLQRAQMAAFCDFYRPRSAIARLKLWPFKKCSWLANIAIYWGLFYYYSRYKKQRLPTFADFLPPSRF